MPTPLEVSSNGFLLSHWTLEAKMLTDTCMEAIGRRKETCLRCPFAAGRPISHFQRYRTGNPSLRATTGRGAFLRKGATRCAGRQPE